MTNFMLLVISVVFGAFGQFFFRVGMKTYGQVGALGAFRQIFSIVFTPYIFIGFILFGLSSVLWLSVISKSQLSYAYPMVSMGYVITLLLSRIFLNEQVGPYRILGVIAIMSGVVLISRS